MRYLTTIPLIAAIIGISGCVTTTPDPKEVAYYDHAPEIMAFVAEDTGKPAAPTPDPVFKDGLPYGAAFYDFGSNTIILPTEWEPDTEGRGSLAHEFTHAVQHQAHPEVRKRQLAWAAAIERGETQTMPQLAKSALDICLTWEAEAYEVGYRYMESIDPKHVRTFLMGTFTIPEASEMHAKMSCDEVQAWHDELHKAN